MENTPASDFLQRRNSIIREERHLGNRKQLLRRRQFNVALQNAHLRRQLKGGGDQTMKSGPEAGAGAGAGAGGAGAGAGAGGVNELNEQFVISPNAMHVFTLQNPKQMNSGSADEVMLVDTQAVGHDPQHDDYDDPSSVFKKQNLFIGTDSHITQLLADRLKLTYNTSQFGIWWAGVVYYCYETEVAINQRKAPILVLPTFLKRHDPADRSSPTLGTVSPHFGGRAGVPTVEYVPYEPRGGAQHAGVVSGNSIRAPVIPSTIGLKMVKYLQLVVAPGLPARANAAPRVVSNKHATIDIAVQSLRYKNFRKLRFYCDTGAQGGTQIFERDARDLGLRRKPYKIPLIIGNVSSLYPCADIVCVIAGVRWKIEAAIMPSSMKVRRRLLGASDIRRVNIVIAPGDPQNVTESRTQQAGQLWLNAWRARFDGVQPTTLSALVQRWGKATKVRGATAWKRLRNSKQMFAVQYGEGQMYFGVVKKIQTYRLKKRKKKIIRKIRITFPGEGTDGDGTFKMSTLIAYTFENLTIGLSFRPGSAAHARYVDVRHERMREQRRRRREQKKDQRRRRREQKKDLKKARRWWKTNYPSAETKVVWLPYEAFEDAYEGAEELEGGSRFSPPPTLTLSNAVKFLDDVKHAFGALPQIYNAFAEAMESFWSGALDKRLLKAYVGQLFLGEGTLQHDFVMFFPRVPLIENMQVTAAA